MKLLLDAMLSPIIARPLRNRGYDVDAIVERPQFRTAADSAILALARSEGRVVVKMDKRDFRLLMAAQHGNHAGVVIVPTRRFPISRQGAIGPIVTALEALLTANPDLTNREHWLS